MTVSSSIGADVWPLLTGLFIEKIPMIFMYLTFAPLASCFVMFLTALSIGKNFKIVSKSHETKEVSEINDIPLDRKVRETPAQSKLKDEIEKIKTQLLKLRSIENSGISALNCRDEIV